MASKHNRLKDVKVAILLTDGFEESEMTSPRDALKEAGAEVSLITLEGSKVRSWQHDKWGKYFKVDGTVRDVKPQHFDALILPGGVMNPDKLRANRRAIKFVNYFMDNEKPIGAICHGPWTLVETKKLKEVKLTSYHSIKSDLINAGAVWVNKKVIRDGHLVTSRTPDDLPAFNKEIIKLFAE